MISQKPYMTNFEHNTPLRNYFSLLESTGKAFRDDGLSIVRAEYNNGYSLLAFDLTPNLQEGGCYHLIRKGNARLELKFDQGFGGPVNVNVYMLSLTLI